MKGLKFCSLLFIGAVVVGCNDPKPTQSLIDGTQQMSSVSSEVDVKLVGTFTDTLAYNEIRGIYRITDNKTGKEYLGISGIGISEVGSHGNGKQTIQDER